jgi:uncharacterized protein
MTAPPDATHPLVLDTRPLRRQAGAMTTVERVFEAPAGWQVSSSWVPQGAPVELAVRLEAVVEGVLVSGTVTVRTEGECSRCLDEVRSALTINLMQLFEYPDQAAAHEAGDDDPMPVLQGELIDLGPTVQDGIVLDLPQVPLCSPDCPGLCAVCGARLADNPGHHHRTTDSRWALLGRLLEENQSVSAHGAGSVDPERKGE